MGNYSNISSMCRVDLFKRSGKWYTTIAVDFDGYYNEPHPMTAFKKAFNKKAGNSFLGMQAICLEPYHKLGYPVSFIVGELE